MDVKHTPGPWTCTAAGDIRANHGWPVATTEIYLGPDIEAANGRLIATAPEMLAALEDGAACLAAWMEIADPEDVREYDERALAAMRAAIAKAKGIV